MATKGTSGGRKSGGQRPLSPKKQAELEARHRQRRRREILGIVFIALGVFFLLSRFPFTGFVGEKLFHFTFGLFGVLANALPFVCAGYGIFAIVMADKNYHGAKSATIWAIVIAVCSLFHVSQSDRMGQGYVNYLVNSFAWGETNMAGGGLFGGLLTYYTSHFFGAGGSYLLFATLLVILIIVLGNLSISQMGEKVGGKIAETASQQKVRHDASKELREQKREAERRERERIEAERRRLFEEGKARQEVELYYSDPPEDLPPARPVRRPEASHKNRDGRNSRKGHRFYNFEVGDRPAALTGDESEEYPIEEDLSADGEYQPYGEEPETPAYRMPDYERFYGQRRPYYELDAEDDDVSLAGLHDEDEGDEAYGPENEGRMSADYHDEYDLFLPPVERPKKKRREKANYVNIQMSAEDDAYRPVEDDIDVFIPPSVPERAERSHHEAVEEKQSKIVPFPFGKKPGKPSRESFSNYDLGGEPEHRGQSEADFVEPRQDEPVFEEEEDFFFDHDEVQETPVNRPKEPARANRPPKSYELPSYELLNRVRPVSRGRENLSLKQQKLQQTLSSFGVEARVTTYHPGPVITRFEVQLAPGVRMSKLTNLANDIAMNMAVQQVRIAPIPGKAAIGIEVPNAEPSSVTLRELLETDEFKRHNSAIAVALGKDIGGKTVIIDIAKMPHLLIAGATGSGKSVCINTILCSFLYKSKPEDLKLILVDPKVVELALYRKMPHLLVPVVTQPQKAASALNRSVSEMEERYRLFEAHGVREIERYNEIARRKGYETIPKLVIVIDELADLMMVSPREVEDAIIRIAQKGRAAGIHLIVATQRPSSDIITGLIKSNIPSRIAFAVASGTDSRIILDTNGAEKLLGKGDMLYLPIGASQPIRMQGALVTDGEIERLQDFFAQQGCDPEFDEGFVNSVEEGSSGEDGKGSKLNNAMDELLPEVVERLMQTGQASTSMIQRRFRIGYTRAARIMDQMEEQGIVSAQDGSKSRNILINREDFEMMFGYPPDIPPLGT